MTEVKRAVSAPSARAARTGTPRVVEALTGRIAAQMLQRLMGFWVIYTAAGGFDALIAAGYARRTVYGNLREFRKWTGHSPEDFLWSPEEAGRLVDQFRSHIDVDAKRVIT